MVNKKKNSGLERVAGLTPPLIQNFIGSGQYSAHPLLDNRRWRIQQLGYVVACLMCMNSVCQVACLYDNGIYVHDERHPIILVSWIETFIFIKGEIIQITQVKLCYSILTNKSHR